MAVSPKETAIFFCVIEISTGNLPQYPHLARRNASVHRAQLQRHLYLERGKMTRTTRLFLIAAFVLGSLLSLSTPAHAQPGYGQGGYGQDHQLLLQRRQDETSATSTSRGVQFACPPDQRLCPVSGTIPGASTTAASGSTAAAAPTSSSADADGGGATAVRQRPSTARPTTANETVCTSATPATRGSIRQISGSPCVRGSTWGYRQPRPLGRPRLPRRVRYGQRRRRRRRRPPWPPASDGHLLLQRWQAKLVRHNRRP